MLTLKDLKEFTNGYLRINREDNTVLSINDINNEKYCKIFKNNYNPKTFVNGIKLINTVGELSLDNIELYYITFDDVKIHGDEEIPPMETIGLYEVYAYFSIHKKTADGDEVIKKDRLKVKAPLIVKGNVYNKFIFPSNETYEDVWYLIESYYQYKGERKCLNGINY